MRALLDVNMLLALFDRAHLFHAPAQAWWRTNEASGWASSPLTENGFLRIVSQRGYPRPVPLADAMSALRAWAVAPRHQFWPDDVTLLDSSVVDHRYVLGPRQLTDIYLLALAVRHGGRLVTLDRGIPIAAVRGAGPEHLAVVVGPAA